MGIDRGVANQFIKAFPWVEIIEIDFIEVVGIPVVAFGKFCRHQTGIAVGSNKEEVIIALFEQHLTEIAMELIVVMH